MAVVLQHFSATAQRHSSGWIPSLVPHGYMAVDFFFVLSGFIMSYTYLAGFEALGIRAYGPFLWKRVARIFPLGIAMTLVVVALGQIAAMFGIEYLFYRPPAEGGLSAMIAVSVLHLHAMFPEYSLNDPSWSVSVELGAYLVFPILIYLMFKTKPWVTAAYTVVGVGFLLLLSSNDPHGGMAFRSPLFDLGRCIVEFGFGMLVYRAFAGRSWIRVIGQDRWTWLFAALAIGALFARSDLLAAAVFPFLVLAFALNDGRASRALSHPVLHYLGVISFSIYLVHHMFREPELWLVRYLHPAPLPPAAALLFAAAGSLSILPFAALAYHGIERPGRSALNSIVHRINRHLFVPRGAARPAD